MNKIGCTGVDVVCFDISFLCWDGEMDREEEDV
eukprot:CAMPEP_0178971104 /NCGR_PEP_ID=MMETSP0789-20121207/20047_1 /TAXON_ID=3005 /ORGANISM="Rhizosolenia setigera, Strain CCMP 1694" /LENGTH=32 /DNA_ID= /DNA_START= /DNA_END= /DNA_ORIENTATION=